MGLLIKALPVLAILIFLSGSADAVSQKVDAWVEKVQVSGGSWTPDPPTKNEGCKRRKRDRLPDPACTPGRLNATLSKSDVCDPVYLAPKQRASAQQNAAVRRAYRSHARTLDMLISPRLGGVTTPANLWPAGAKQQARKDRIEQKLLRRVCTGKLSLRQAQWRLAQDWRKAAR